MVMRVQDSFGGKFFITKLAKVGSLNMFRFNVIEATVFVRSHKSTISARKLIRTRLDNFGEDERFCVAN